MTIYTIYLATNKLFPNKHYIGYDKNYPERMQTHLYQSFNSNMKKYRFYWYNFHQTLRKFGKENFDWEIIYQSTDLNHIKEMEKHFIIEYNSHYKKGNGYNMTDGGEGFTGGMRTEKWKKNHSLKISGKNNPNYGKKGILNHNFGRKKSKEEIERRIEKISKKWKFVSPTNDVYIVTGRPKFCQDHQLSAGNLSKYGYSKGWTCELYDDK